MNLNYEEELGVRVKDWLNKQQDYRFRHYKQLDMANPIIEKVVQYNNNLNRDYVYQKLKLFYWQKCDDVQEFEQVISGKLDNGCRILSELIE